MTIKQFKEKYKKEIQAYKDLAGFDIDPSIHDLDVAGISSKDEEAITELMLSELVMNELVSEKEGK